MLFLRSPAFRDRAFQCCGRRDGHAGRGGFPHENNLRRGQGVGLVDEVAEGPLQSHGFDGEGAGGRAEKLKSGKQKAEIARRRTWHRAAASCRGYALRLTAMKRSPARTSVPQKHDILTNRPLRHSFLTRLVFALRFTRAAFSFQPFSFFLRSQSSNVRRVCCWPDMISIRRRTKWVKPCVGGLSPVIGPTYGLARLRPVYPPPFTLPARLVRWSVAQARPGPPSCAWR